MDKIKNQLNNVLKRNFTKPINTLKIYFGYVAEFGCDYFPDYIRIVFYKENVTNSFDYNLDYNTEIYDELNKILSKLNLEKLYIIVYNNEIFDNTKLNLEHIANVNYYYNDQLVKSACKY
jgi:hypothetical protein